MAQVATVSSVDNLFSYNPKSFSITTVSTYVGEIVAQLEQELSFIKSASVFAYSNRIRITLSVNGDAREFALLKGLLEFHRLRHFQFTYDRDARLVEADVNEADFAALKDYLLNTGSLLRKEKVFKSALKQVMAFEEKYRSESARVYNSLIAVPN